MIKRLALTILALLIFVAEAGAASVVTTTTITFPPATYPPNTYSLPETSVPVGITSATLSIAPWNGTGTVVHFKVDLSSDGGLTWFTGDPPGVGWCAFTAKGNTLVLSGNIFLTCTCTLASNCDPTNVNNKVRGTIIVTGGTITTSGSLVVQ